MNKSRILVFGAHPDDIEVGCGGTVAKYTKNGHDVLCVVCVIPNNHKLRKMEAMKSAEILDAKILFLDTDPNNFILNRQLIEQFDNIINEYNPDIVFTHWKQDSHQDHRVVCDATIASSRKNKHSLYMYEQTIPGGIVPYGFLPQMYINISDTIDQKIKSILSHASEVDKHNKDRIWEYGIKGRASYRGYQINEKYAEAFEVVKEIKNII